MVLALLRQLVTRLRPCSGVCVMQEVVENLIGLQQGAPGCRRCTRAADRKAVPPAFMQEAQRDRGSRWCSVRAAAAQPGDLLAARWQRIVRLPT